MIRGHIAAVALAWTIVTLPVAWSAPPPAAQREIEHLLAYLEASGCDFQRSGQWHDAPAARAHIETKYKYLLQRDLVQSTDDFLVKAATSSSVGGGAYQVRCHGMVQPSAQWLRAELARLRQRGVAAPKP